MRRIAGRTAVALLAVMALLTLLCAPFIGQTVLLPADVRGGGLDARIFWQLRVPRVLVAFVAGGALALGGAVFQAVFRNSLATPFTLGLSGGASLGAALALRLGLAALLGSGAVTLSAFAGALVSVGLVYGIGRLKRNCSTTDLLLAGVAVNFLFSSAIMALQFLGKPDQTLQLLHWMMGGVFVSGFKPLLHLAAPVALGSAVLLLHARDLDLLLLGDDLAVSRGVDVRRLRWVLFLAVSLTVGAVVALCGPIGFVGLMVPHACRRVVGAHHRLLGPVCLLAGGVLLVLCDTVARTVVAPVEMPLGVITALLGAPFFLWLLYAGRTDP